MQQNYLTAMGIQTWKARQQLPGAKLVLNFQIYSLHKESAEVGYLLFDTSLESAGYEEKIENMLDAMLRAIQLQKTNYQNFEVVQQKLASGQCENILIMGKDLLQKLKYRFALPEPVNLVHHPLELLLTPANKRQAWLDLQLFAKKVNCGE